MQAVHTRMRLGAPPTTAWTRCRFTFQRRLVTLWAWLMRFPNCGPRPQTSHTFAILLRLPHDVGLGRPSVDMSIDAANRSVHATFVAHALLRAVSTLVSRPLP